jgi:sugar diacid utilization regulator
MPSKKINAKDVTLAMAVMAIATVLVVAKVAQKAVAHAQKAAQTQHAVVVADAAVVVVNEDLVLKVKEQSNVNALMQRIRLRSWTATTRPKKTHATSSAQTAARATNAEVVPHAVASATTTQSVMKPAHKPTSKTPVKFVPKALRMTMLESIEAKYAKVVQDAEVAEVEVAMTVAHAPRTAAVPMVPTMVKRS